MDCSKPNGCPTPADCSGNGCCSDVYIIENHDLQRPDTFEVQSETFDQPLALTLRDMAADIERTMAAVNDINARLDLLTRAR